VPKNWEARDKKLDKRRNGMRVSGRSIFVIEESEAKRNKRKVEKMKERKSNGNRD
jgi:hypothetical protein